MTTQMQRVAGLIVGLPATRLAIITRRVNGMCIASTTSITGSGLRADTLTERNERILYLRNEILYAAALAELVVTQDPGVGPRGASAPDRIGLWWAVVGKLLDPEGLAVPVAVSALTARPQSPAADLAGVITPLWPETRLSAPQEAEALALAHLGAVRLGWNVPTLRGEGLTAALGTPAWPDIPRSHASAPVADASDLTRPPAHPDPPVV